MNITLLPVYDGNVYFGVSYDHTAYVSSSEIANLLDLNVEEYNNILVEKVVKHNQFHIIGYYGIANPSDLTFNPLDICNEAYINRFKETFAAQLTILTLEEKKK